MPTSKDPTAPKLDLVGAALSIVGLVTLVYGLIEAPDNGWSSVRSRSVSFASRPWSCTGFVPLGAAQHRTRCSTSSFFRNPRFTAASAGIALIFFAMFGVDLPADAVLPVRPRLLPARGGDPAAADGARR